MSNVKICQYVHVRGSTHARVTWQQVWSDKFKCTHWQRYTNDLSINCFWNDRNGKELIKESHYK